MTVPQALELALQHHQAGRLAEAEALYRQILAVEPGHADALHLLGVVAHQVGRHDVAVELIRQAISLLPTAPAFFSNLGGAYEKLGRHEEAVTAFRRAIELNPDYPEAHNNLGNVLRIQRQTGEAVAAFRRAIQLRPDYAEALSNLGNALTDQGNLDDAIDAFRQAIHLRPDLPEAFSNLGAALRERGDLDDALICLRRALELNPDLPATLNNLSVVLRDLGRDEEAVASCQRALQLRPDYASAYNNLGLALVKQWRLEEAVVAYRRAIQLQPGYAPAYNNLGLALAHVGHLDAAIEAYNRVIQLKSDLSRVHGQLGKSPADQGQIPEANPTFRNSVRRTPGSAEAHSNLLLILHYPAEADPPSLAAEHRRWDEIHAKPLAGLIGVHGNTRDPERRLRVGYVSPDFREHSVAFFLEGLLSAHDREKVEVFCYADSMGEDGFTARFRGYAAHWRQITGKNDAQVAELIREDGIDILVDLAGHTAGNRLLVFARKPAPVQVTYLGYPDTTGLAAMDYRLTDAQADPPGTTEHLHTEQLVRLPEVLACFRPPDAAPPVRPLPALARGQVTFASFHNMAKLNDRLLEHWATILQQTPHSRLMIVASGLDQISTRQRFIEFFGRHGVGAERLAFTGRASLAQYLALHHEVDLMLDSHPFSGHTVSCHALWMGVPMVTLAGASYCSRMVASVLTSVGLPELIAHSPAEYVEIATALAADLPRLAALRSSLRARMAASPLMDAPRFARNVEQAYRQMWRAWCNHRSSFPAA